MGPKNDPPERYIEIRFLPDPIHIRTALIEAENACRTLQPNMDPDQLGDIQIVLAEVLNNIAEHAFSGAQPEVARLTLSTTGPWLDAVAEDAGRPLPNLTPPDPDLPATDVACDDLPEGGFGWFLVQQLSDKVSYERIDEMNRLCLRFCLKTRSQ